MPSLLDTDILSEVLKHKDVNVVRKAAAYLQANNQFTFSSITRFEVLRGLKEKKATRQLQQFAVFCQHSSILAITDDILELASDLWAMSRQQGRPIVDADLIIAATALVHGLLLVTGNSVHFTWIPGLTLENWPAISRREIIRVDSARGM